MPLKFQNDGQTYAAYLQGRCVAVTSDRALLAAKRSSFPDPKAHVLLAGDLSKEPLATATVNGDPVWADAVRWITYALMQAEESGITQANVEAKLAEAKADPNQADPAPGQQQPSGRQVAHQVAHEEGHQDEHQQPGGGLNKPRDQAAVAPPWGDRRRHQRNGGE